MNKTTDSAAARYNVIFDTLREFRLSNMMFEDGEGFYPLVDAMTAEGRSIADGEEQMRDLAAEIVSALDGLAAAPTSAPEPVEIKQLEWRAYGNQNPPSWQGKGPMGYLRYVTNRGPDGEEGWWCDGEMFDTADQAKAAAQADFEARIRNSFVTTDKG